jgi:purine-binding chemotaxis protein CheW
VVDIIQHQAITPVPNCPIFVKGITNLRGKVIPIIDLRLRFGKEPQEYNDRTCIIVLEERGVTVGLVVDSVATTLDLDDDQIAPPPTFAQGLDTRFIRGVGHSSDGVTLILDCQMVLDDNLVDAKNLSDEDEY